MVRRHPKPGLSPSKFAEIRTTSVRDLNRWLITALLLVSASLAAASPTYRYQSLIYGDTAYVADINDLGAIAWSGCCDGGCSSRVGQLGANQGRALYFVRGLDGTDYSFVTDINNSGDLLGSSINAAGQLVATLWLNSLAYDLSDPANAGLQFNHDPGPKRVPFDQQALDAIDLPPQFLPNAYGEIAAQARSSALTSSRGDLVFEYSVWFSGSSQFAALTQVVNEPPAWALVVPALLALGIRRRPSRKR